MTKFINATFGLLIFMSLGTLFTTKPLMNTPGECFFPWIASGATNQKIAFLGPSVFKLRTRVKEKLWKCNAHVYYLFK